MLINRFDPAPLYSQVALRIREMIAANRFAPGQEIPSEAELEKEFGVSRITIRRAIDELASESLLVKARGKRTCTAPPKIDQPLNCILGFSEAATNAGMKPQTKSIEITRQTLPQYYQDLVRGTAFSSRVIKVKRIRTADGKPISLITSYIPEKLVPGLIGSALINDSLFQTLAKRYGIVLHKADQIVEAKPASSELAGLLMVRKGYPLLALTQLTYNQHQQVVEVVEVLSRSDRYRYHTHLVPYTLINPGARRNGAAAGRKAGRQSLRKRHARGEHVG